MSGFRDKLRESRTSLASVFRNPGLRRVQLAWAGSIIGEWAFNMSVLVYAYQQGGATAVGVLQVVSYMARAILGPVTATLVDRMPRKRVMIGSDVLSALIVFAAAGVVAADGPALVVYALTISMKVATTPFNPAQKSLLPQLARDPGELTAANVSSSTIESVGFFAGPAIGGLLLTVATIPTVFVFNGLSFVWSAALVLGVASIAPRAEEAGSEQDGGKSESFLAETLAGFRTIFGNRFMALLMGLSFAQTIVAGASSVFVVAIAFDLLGLGKGGPGFIESALGVGALIGGFLALVLAQRGRLALDFGVGVILWAAPLLLVVVSPTIAAVVAAMFLMGVGNSLVDINIDTILQRIVPTEVMGRVFGAMWSVVISGMALGALLMPLLIHLVGVRGGLAFIGVGVSAIVLLGAPGLRRIDATILAPAGLPLLRSIEMLARLPEPIIERLARALVPETASTGDVVIRQGEAGDHVYIIESGTVEVTRDGRHIADLGPGELFGEIALLRAVPRTATVIATSDCTFQTLTREVFIPAVTREREAHESAESTVSSRLAML